MPTTTVSGTTNPVFPSSLTGVTDGSVATAGQVGEVITATASAVAVGATGVTANVASISLTAGDWLISGMVNIGGGATGLTAGTVAQMSIVTTTAGNGVLGTTMSQASVLALLASGLFGLSIPALHTSISSTITHFLTAQVSYVAGTPTASGIITAVRIR